MGNVEKTVFISYRHKKDVSWALAVYSYLSNKYDYDVFFDYTSIDSGDFEKIIVNNIKARAHFLVVLTPTALNRCNDPEDWLRREIETAIDEKRNIIPLFFDNFNFGSPAIARKLSGKLKMIERYNGLSVPDDYFEEAMEKLHTRYLNIALDSVLHPISLQVQKIVEAQQNAANKAISRIFISFAVEDRTYRDFLVGQARNKKKPFEPVDTSIEQPWDSSWKTNCRTKIRGCDGMIALVSKNTAKASGQLWEVNCAKEERIPVRGIYVDVNNKPVSLPSEFLGIHVMNWTWDNIANFLNSL